MALIRGIVRQIGAKKNGTKNIEQLDKAEVETGS